MLPGKSTTIGVNFERLKFIETVAFGHTLNWIHTHMKKKHNEERICCIQPLHYIYIYKIHGCRKWNEGNCRFQKQINLNSQFDLNFPLFCCANFKLSLGIKSFWFVLLIVSFFSYFPIMSISISVGLIWHPMQTYIWCWTDIRHENKPNKGNGIPCTYGLSCANKSEMHLTVCAAYHFCNYCLVLSTCDWISSCESAKEILPRISMRNACTRKFIWWN